MRLPGFLTRALLRLVLRVTALRRSPDQIIGEGSAYMLRWWLFGASRKPDRFGNKQPRRPFGYSFYVHCFLRSDDDRALHDHPWNYASLILFGTYDEVLAGHTQRYSAGTLRFGKAETAHRIQLVTQDYEGYHEDMALIEKMPWMQMTPKRLPTEERIVWTLFMCGKWRRDWGFHCPRGWVWWREFVRPEGGCDG